MNITYVAVSPFIASCADTFTVDTSSSIETVWFASSCNFWQKKSIFVTQLQAKKVEESSLVPATGIFVHVQTIQYISLA